VVIEVGDPIPVPAQRDRTGPTLMEKIEAALAGQLKNLAQELNQPLPK
jgi:hypothetical protein